VNTLENNHIVTPTSKVFATERSRKEENNEDSSIGFKGVGFLGIISVSEKLLSRRNTFKFLAP
jgi:hypothetical protein